MENYEYFRDAGFKVASSATEIRKAVTFLRKEPSKYKTYLDKLRWETEENGEVSTTWDGAKSWLEHHRETVEHDIRYKYDETDVNSIANLLEMIANGKADAQKRMKDDRVALSSVTPDYAIPGLIKDKEVVELFNRTPEITPNEHDRKLMSCFAIMGNAVVYKSVNKCYRLMTKTTNGRPQIVFSAGDSGDQGVINDIIGSLAMNFKRYMKILIEKVTELNQFPDTDNGDSYTPIEQIFLDDVPTIFRHFVEVRRIYKKVDPNDKKSNRIFQNYYVSAKRTVGELTVDAFVEWLSNNWIKATRGILENTDKYLVYSNTPSKLSVHRFVIWPKSVWSKAVIPESWDKVFGAKASERLLDRLYFFIGSLLDADNCAQQYLAISDPGQTGKGLLVELISAVLENLLGTNMLIHLDNSVFKDENQFGLASIQVWNYRIGVVDEYDGRSLNSNKGKSIIGGDCRTLDMKFSDSVQWDTKQFRIIAPSNCGFVLKQNALRRRCIPITFRATHCSLNNMNTADKEALIKDGEQFMMFCWRKYQESPFRQADGGYFIACPEDEKRFLDGDWMVDTGEVNIKTGEHIYKPYFEDRMRYLRAFSKDKEISSYYTVDDYDDSEITDGYNKFIDKYCIQTDNDSDCIYLKDLMKLVEVNAEVDKDLNLPSIFGDALKKKGIKSGEMYEFNYRSADYKTFKKYLENHGHSSKREDNGFAFLCLKFKPQYYIDGKVVIQSDSSDGVYRQSSTITSTNLSDIDGIVKAKPVYPDDDEDAA